MKKISRLMVLLLLTISMSGCCFSVGSIVIGKDCNKKMYCNSNSVELEYSYSLPTSYSTAYQKSLKSIVMISASSASKATSSTGSGIIIQSDDNYLYIVTNRHVLATKTSNYSIFHSNIEVLFSDYSKVNGELVAASTDIDVAVVKVSKQNLNAEYQLPVVKNSFTDIKIGDNILAIGSPLGQNHAFSASFGVISNLYNTKVDFISSGLGYYYPIQIDATVNPGNSGGGLFNINGDLIGMIQGGRTTSNEDSSTVEVTGINYAIPITTVINVATNLITNNVYQKAQIGIDDTYITDLKTMSSSDRLALGINENDKQGLFIRHTNNTGAAYIAGMKSHFIINEVDEMKIETVGQWDMYICSKNKGDVITVKGHYKNNTSEVSYQITLK